MLFDTSAYQTETEQYRSRIVYITVTLLVVFYTLYAMFIPEWVNQQNPEADLTMLVNVVFNEPFSAIALLFYSIYVAGVAIYFLNRSGYAQIAAWLLIGVWYLSGVVLTVMTSSFPAYSGMAIMVLLVMSAMLIGTRAIIVSLGISILTLAVRLMDGGLEAEAVTAMFNTILLTTNGALLLFFFIRIFQLNRIEGESAVVQERVLASEVLTHIAERVAQRVDLETLLGEIVQVVNQRYDEIYHTQVFMTEDKTNMARLVASTGDVGRKLMAQNHGLGVGSESVIGQVTLSGNIVVARMGDSVHRQNSLLPETRVEIGFPLRLGDKVIGVLDVQSKQKDFFITDHETASFQALADSLALAIDNVSQFERAEARVQENQRLADEAQEALRQIERMNERLTGRAWSEYLQSRGGQLGVDLDFETDSVRRASSLTNTLQDAMRINQFVQDQQNGHQTIAVPLRVQGRVIGAMEFELDGEQGFSPEDFDLLQEVGERFGLAVENARLVDASQRVAQREALVNQISARLQTTNSVESMLNEAAKSLQSTLKARKIAIRLGAPPSMNGKGS